MRRIKYTLAILPRMCVLLLENGIYVCAIFAVCFLNQTINHWREPEQQQSENALRQDRNAAIRS